MRRAPFSLMGAQAQFLSCCAPTDKRITLGVASRKNKNRCHQPRLLRQQESKHRGLHEKWDQSNLLACHSSIAHIDSMLDDPDNYSFKGETKSNCALAHAQTYIYTEPSPTLRQWIRSSGISLSLRFSKDCLLWFQWTAHRRFRRWLGCCSGFWLFNLDGKVCNIGLT